MKLRIRKEIWILFCAVVMCEAGCASDNTQEQDILQNATEQVSNTDTVHLGRSGTGRCV